MRRTPQAQSSKRQKPSSSRRRATTPRPRRRPSKTSVPVPLAESSRNSILEGINRLFHQALTCETDEELGMACLAIAEEVTESKFGFIGELNAEGRLDDIAISNPGWETCQMPTRIGSRRVPIGFKVHGIYGRVILDNKSFYTNDPASHPDHIGTPEGHPPLTSFLGVPLIQNGKTIGMVGLGNREGGYRDRDLQAAQALAPTIVQVLAHKRMEVALRQRGKELEAARIQPENEKRRLQAVMDALPVGVAITDAEGGNVQANSAFEQVWRGPRPQTDSVNDYAAYQAWWADTGKPVAPEEWASAEAVQKGVSVVGQVFEIQRFDGSHAFVINSASPVRDASGKIVGSAVAIQDITDLRRTEASLQEALRRIEKLNAALEQRAGELEVANGELERLAVSLAYDVRSPLISINSVSDTIAHDYGGQLPEHAQQLFQLIHANTEEMDHLTQGLVRLMRITRQPLHKQEIDPERMIRSAIEELRAEVGGRPVGINIAPLPTCQADPLLLKQVWIALLSNALKFTRPHERACIEIGARREETESVYFIKDDGVGFDMSYAGTIFRAFQRYHHPEEFPGTGEGLAIVERIVRRHGGRVWAEGAVGQGATFYFTLS